MPVPCRKWLACYTLAALVLLQGCGQKSEEGFHTYNDPAPAAPPEGGSGISVSPSDAVPPVAGSDESLSSAATPQPATTTPAPAQAPMPSATVTPGTPAGPSAAEGVPKTEPTSNSSASHELALALPPPPPEAVPLGQLAAGGSPMPAREIKLLIPEKDFQVEGPEGAIRVTFDDIDLLKVLNADPVPVDIEQHLPSWLSGLDGKMVRIRGWMFPPNQESDLPAFLFVRDNQICCFGRKPMVYDKFGVRLREGVTTNYIQGRPFDVVGRMVVKSRLVDDELFWLYMINDAIVIDK